jgi:hypothetical protein
VPLSRNFCSLATHLHELSVVAGAAAFTSRSFALRMQGRSAPDPTRGVKDSRHKLRRRHKAAHKTEARRVLESVAPVRDLRLSIRGRDRAASGSRTVRSAPPVLPAPAAPPGLNHPAALADQPAEPAPFAEAALAQAEHRASLLADHPLQDRPTGPRPPPAAPVAEPAPPAPLPEAERLDYQSRLVNLERFSTGLSSLVDTPSQARALWAANARLSALEPGSLPLTSWVDAAAACPPVAWPDDLRPASAGLPPNPGAAPPPWAVGSSPRDSASPTNALVTARGQTAIPPWAVARVVVAGPLPPRPGSAPSRSRPPETRADSRSVRPRPDPAQPAPS